MKIAIGISGQLRKARVCSAGIHQHIITPLAHHDVDVYMTSWDNPSFKGNRYSGTNDCSWEEMLDFYKPKASKLLNEAEHVPIAIKDIAELEHPSRQNAGNKMHNVLCMIYQIKQCSDLIRDTNIPYDVVIRLRYDIMPTVSIEPILNPGLFCIPAGNDHLDGINDQVAWGPLKDMLYYGNWFTEVVNLVQSGLLVHPETLLRHHLLRGGINLNRPAFPYVLT